MNSQQLKKILLPETPGVYFFRAGKDILYIGKATTLRSRVGSYFSHDLIKTRGAHMVDMVFRADTITWEETDTVLEALILEAALIKKHQPYYNKQERDDKSFLCVGITSEDFPRVLTIRKKDIDPAKKTAVISRGHERVKLQAVYGPFTSGGALKDAMRIIRRIFPYRDAMSSKKDNYEFYRQLNLTPDTTTLEKKREYQKTIRHIKLFFEGKKKKIIAGLEREMHTYARKQEFEKANEVKRRLFALTHINDISLIKREDWEERGDVRPFRIEAYDIAHMSGKNMVGVMTVVRNQTAWKDGYRMFRIKSVEGANDPAALREVLERRLKHPEWGVPDLIVVDGNRIQIDVAEKVLAEVKLKVPIAAVVKDDRHKARAILGDPAIVESRKQAIILANAEAHRFAIAYHKKRRGKAFLG